LAEALAKSARENSESRVDEKLGIEGPTSLCAERGICFREGFLLPILYCYFTVAVTVAFLGRLMFIISIDSLTGF